MKRLLVTGASGFIGSHVVRLALDAGIEVGVLAMPGDPMRRLTDIAGHLQVFRSPLEDRAALCSAVQQLRPDACIHLAWYAEPGKYLEAPENVACLKASLDLLEELISCGCACTVMAGTCAEYASGPGHLTEDSPVKPETLYAACKLSTGLIGAQRAKAAGVRFAWGRLFYLYGPGEDPRRLVPSLTRALAAGETFEASSGEQIRDFLHVADAGAAFLALAGQGASGVYNICSGHPTRVRQVMEVVGRHLHRTDLIRYGAKSPRGWEPPSIAGSNEGLRALGWGPRFTLESGLANTVDWWLNEGGVRTV